MKKINVIRLRYVFLGASGALMLVALFAIAAFGFEQGIDFKGGTLWRFSPGVALPSSEVQSALQDAGVHVVSLALDPASGVFLARLPFISDADHQTYRTALEGTFENFNELSFESIGPSVGERLRQNAIKAIVLVLLGISLYVAFAFRKASRPIASWKYGVVTLITLFHDILITAGLLAFLGRFAGVEIDSNFVVALLVVAGFSVHDTIVVFDRIRERLSIDRGKTEFDAVVNQSVHQTMVRSMNTSLTLMLVLVALVLVGPPTLRYFVITLLVGVTIGTYSSIFVASPGLFILRPRGSR